MGYSLPGSSLAPPSLDTYRTKWVRPASRCRAISLCPSGRRTIMYTTVAISGFACISTSVATSYWWYLIFRAVIGHTSVTSLQSHHIADACRYRIWRCRVDVLCHHFGVFGTVKAWSTAHCFADLCITFTPLRQHDLLRCSVCSGFVFVSCSGVSVAVLAHDLSGDRDTDTGVHCHLGPHNGIASMAPHQRTQRCISVCDREIGYLSICCRGSDGCSGRTGIWK